MKVNVTAYDDARPGARHCICSEPDEPSYVSVFAGRIADTGRPTVGLMTAAVELLKVVPAAELIWASPRELYNIFEADLAGCHIITATPDVLKKLSLVGYDLDAYSLDTVKMFYNDAVSAGFNSEKPEACLKTAPVA